MSDLIVSAVRKCLGIATLSVALSSGAHADVIVETQAGQLRGYKHQAHEVSVHNDAEPLAHKRVGIR
jgi:hypothetical protein